MGLFGDFFLSDLYRPKVKVLFGTLLCRVCRKGRRRVSTSKLRVMEREDESDEEEEEEELLNRLLIAALMFEEILFGGPEKRKRSGNRKRNREHVQRTIDGWTDLMFRRQFRMTRSSFGKLRDIIDRQFPPRDGEMARRSSGSTVSTTIRLYVTLRVLAGASYLDMVWYEVPVNSVMPIVIDMSTKITQVLQNVTLPTAVEDLEAIASRGLCKKTRFVIGQNIVGFVKVLF